METVNNNKKEKFGIPTLSQIDRLKRTSMTLFSRKSHYAENTMCKSFELKLMVIEPEQLNVEAIDIELGNGNIEEILTQVTY